MAVSSRFVWLLVCSIISVCSFSYEAGPRGPASRFV
jgi:hypothetical protein